MKWKHTLVSVLPRHLEFVHGNVCEVSVNRKIKMKNMVLTLGQTLTQRGGDYFGRVKIV